MIEYTNETKPHIMFFADDGSWGSADDIVIVDTIQIDSHWSDMMDELRDWQRPSFMRWYVDNQGHDQMKGDYTTCQICELWEDGTEAEILADLENDTE